MYLLSTICVNLLDLFENHGPYCTIQKYLNHSTNRYRWYNNYSATQLRTTCGDHDKKRNWFEDHACDKAVNDKSKCVESNVRDTQFDGAYAHLAYTHTCTY